MTGKIYQINVKPKTPGEHGLKKRPVDSAVVSLKGVEGDHNSFRQDSLNGDPDQAVMIMPLEMIEQLNSEGWPIKPGDIGENVTTQGVPYDFFEVGSQYKIGGTTVQITKPCVPCRYLYTLPYIGNEKGPGFLRTMIERRGWYARVIEEGEMKVSDAVEKAG